MRIVEKEFGELTLDELYEILRCRAEVFGVEQEILYVDPDGIDKESVHMYIEGDDGLIAAYLRVIRPGVKCETSSIGRVLTMKQYRGHGMARVLMARAIEKALKMSNEIEIEAQAYLKGFYESLGFEATSDVFILEGLPHVSMVLRN